MIEYLEDTPDTVITLINGHKIVVNESVSDVVELVIKFKHRCISGFQGKE